MKYYSVNKTLVMGIIILFIGICIIPIVNSTTSKQNTQLYLHLDYYGSQIYPDSSYYKITRPFSLIATENLNYNKTFGNKYLSKILTDSKVVKKSSNLQYNGDTLYVGGSGANNYTKIQDAIDDATNGDTVFVYDDSSPYNERYIKINNSIRLIGENIETTILDGNQKGWGIDIGVDGVTISGFTIQEYGAEFNPFNYGGIMIFSSNNIISGNNIINSCYGVVISGSNVPADNNNVSDNSFISNSDCGAYIQESNNNIISNNKFIDNYVGMVLDLPRYNNISDNIFINDGIWVSQAYQNIYFNNTVNNKPLVVLEEESNKILEENCGQIILVNCENITVQNQNLSNTTVGLQLENSHNCQISNNTFGSNDLSGIYMRYSDSNNISNSYFSEEYLGVFSYYSNKNTFFSNTVSSSSWNGILIRCSNSNNISMNTFLDNKCGLAFDGDSMNNIVSDNIFINDGVFVYGAWKNTFLNNFVNNKPLIYLEDKSDIVIDGNAGQVILVSCNNITVKNQEIYDTYAGIILIVAHNCHISDNVLSSNRSYGIFQTYSNNNNISMNTISDNNNGVFLEFSDYNIFYGNTICSNGGHGLKLEHSNYNIVNFNIFEENGGPKSPGQGVSGIFLIWSSNCDINYNNFLNNARDSPLFFESFENDWNRNYWNRPRIFPKIIVGSRNKIFFRIRFNFDWRPALRPFDI